MAWLRVADPPAQAPASVTTYAKPTGTDPANPPPERWIVRVNGQVTWAHYTPRGEVATVSSDATGPVVIQVEAKPGSPAYGVLTKAEIYTQQEGIWPPLSHPLVGNELKFSLPYTLEDNVLTFELPTGYLGNVAVIFNDRFSPTPGTWDHFPFHVMIGILPVETWTPTPAQVTHYFGPGIHTGSTINLQSGQSVYIHGSALVRRTIQTEFRPTSRKSNIRVGGRGVIDSHPNYSPAAEDGLNNLDFVMVDGLTVEGIAAVTKGRWNLTPYLCDGVTAQWLRLVSCEIQNAPTYDGEGTPDGLDPVATTNLTCSNTLISASDDSTAIKCDKYGHVGPSTDIEFKDCLFLQGGKSNGSEIGYEVAAQEVSRVRYRRIALVTCWRDSAPYRTASFTIHHPGSGPINDVLFEDCWCQNLNGKDYEFFIETWYSTSHSFSLSGDANRGEVSNVTYRRVHWPTYETSKRWRLRAVLANAGTAAPEKFLRNITFDNCYSKKQKITAPDSDWDVLNVTGLTFL